MKSRLARLATAVALAAALAIPAAVLAADPDPTGPPQAVQDWQAHLDHMRSMDGTPGDHIADCVAVHGSMAGMLGPNGSMDQMMGGTVGQMMGGGMMR